MKKILVISANSYRDEPVFPEGPLSIAKSLEKGNEVEIFLLFDEGQMNPETASGFRISLAGKIGSFRPDIVFLSVRNQRDIVALARDAVSLLNEMNIYFYVGGPAISIFHDRAYRELGIPKARTIRGEFEQYFTPAGNRKRNTGKAFDMAPLPDSTTIGMICNLDDFKEHRPGDMSKGIDWKRGCPFSCVYCSSPRLSGRRLRARPVRDVIENIIELNDMAGIRDFFFTDCVFNAGRERQVSNMLLSLAESFPKDNYPDIRFRAFLVPPLKESHVEILTKLNFQVELGLDGLTDASLYVLEKPFDEDDIRYSVALLKKHEIPFTIYTMWGIPGQTMTDIRRELKRLKDLGPDEAWISTGIMVYPRTKLFRALKESGTVTPVELLPACCCYSNELKMESLKKKLQNERRPNWHLIGRNDAG